MTVTFALAPNPSFSSAASMPDGAAAVPLFTPLDLINQILALRLTLGMLAKSQAAPLPSSSQACQQYGNETI